MRRRIYVRKHGGATFGIGAPEMRERIQSHAKSTLGLNITMSFLRHFANTDYLYGAMRAAQSGRTNHPIIEQWLEDHPSKDDEEPQLALF